MSTPHKHQDIHELMSVTIYANKDGDFLSKTIITDDLRSHLLVCDKCRTQFAYMMSNVGVMLSTPEGIREINGTHDLDNPRIEVAH